MYHEEQKPLLSYGGNLYSNLIRALPRNGREVKRMGGSSGICRKDNHFRGFFQTHGCFPRKGGGIICLPLTPLDRDNPTSWRCIYMSPYKPYQSSMVTVDYTPPVEGGKMKLNSNLLGQFPKLVDFFCVKKELVELLEELNQKNNISIIPSKISQFLKEVKGKSF